MDRSLEQMLTEHGSDICECGDFRSQHDDGGKCRVCGGLSGGYNGCKEFRFAHIAQPLDRMRWDSMHVPVDKICTSTDPVSGERCGRSEGHENHVAEGDGFSWHVWQNPTLSVQGEELPELGMSDEDQRWAAENIAMIGDEDWTADKLGELLRRSYVGISKRDGEIRRLKGERDLLQIVRENLTEARKAAENSLSASRADALKEALDVVRGERLEQHDALLNMDVAGSTSGADAAYSNAIHDAETAILARMEKAS